MRPLVLCIACTLATAATAVAQTPSLGGPMKHIMVGFDDTALHVHVDDAVATPILRDPGVAYAEPAGVLVGSMHNAQYGWMIEGAWQLPPDTLIYIQQLTSSAGLSVYSGRTLASMPNYSPIFGTLSSGPTVQWSGTMLHNWYATHTPGAHSARYRVYLGDAVGDPVVAFQPADVTLEFIALPACIGDADQNGQVLVNDIFTYLNAWFASSPTADIDGEIGLTILDVFAFLNAWFAGC